MPTASGGQILGAGSINVLTFAVFISFFCLMFFHLAVLLVITYL